MEDRDKDGFHRETKELRGDPSTTLGVTELLTRGDGGTHSGDRIAYSRVTELPARSEWEMFSDTLHKYLIRILASCIRLTRA